ncbi:MAG: vitamin K epoxide reductase family protein [Candidatus Kerfeldbacteria bacterium]|jgi:uncharacterized membrane protein
MRRKASLITILVIAIAGIIFSGYLSYYTLFAEGCSEAIISCGGSDSVEIFGLPTCVYGFFMYLVVIILTIITLLRDKKRCLQKAILIIGIAGLLFSGYLSVYELFFQNTEFTELPACVYGFVMYLGIVIVASLGLSKKNLALDSHVQETEITKTSEQDDNN